MAALSSLVLCSSVLHAADAPKRALLFVKALVYERRLSQTKGESIGIVVLYAPSNEASELAARQWVASLESHSSLRVDGVRIEVMAAAYDPPSVRKTIRAKGIDVLLACEGVPFREVSSIAAEHDILSAGDTPAGVRESLSLGVFITESKPRIVINMRAAKAEGAKFSSKLLQLADVI